MRLTSKIYALALITAGFVLLGAVVAANVVIDPQRMFGIELFSDKRNANLRYLQYLAYRKAEPSIGGLMFASSRGSGWRQASRDELGHFKSPLASPRKR